MINTIPSLHHNFPLNPNRIRLTSWITGLLAIILLLGFATSASAQIALWNFEDNVSPTGVSASILASNVTISTGSINFQNGDDDGGTKIGNAGSWNQGAFDVAEKYLQFSVTPNSGFGIDYSSITLRFGRTSSGPTAVTVQYSLDNFATAGVTILDGESVSSTNTGSLNSFTIPASALPSGDVEETLTIRIWGHDATGTGNLRFNNFRVFGDVNSTTTNPILLASVASIEGLDYPEGQAEPPAQSFTVTGENMDGTNDVTVTAPTSFQVSNTSGTADFGPTVTLTDYDGSPVTIWVRLQPGLGIGSYSGDLTITGGGAPVENEAEVALSGEVAEAKFLIYEFIGNTVEPAQSPVDATASDFQLSDGNITFGSTGTWSGSGTPYAQGTGGWDEESSDEAKFFFFTLEADPGFVIDATELSFEHTRTGAGPEQMTVTANGFVLFSDEIGEVVTGFAESLPSVGFRNLSEIEVRIKGWDGGSGQFRVNDVFLDGSVSETQNLSLPYSNEFRTVTELGDAFDNFFFANTNVELRTSAGGYLNILREGIFESPAIDFTELTGLMLEFDLETFGGESGQELTLFLSDDDGDTYTSFRSFKVPSDYETFTAYVDLTGDLNVERGKFKFEMTDGDVGSGTRFRDFSVQEASVATIREGAGDGWRFLSSPVEGATYSTLLDPIWTQGPLNSNDPGSSHPNILLFDGTASVNDEYSPLADMNTAIPAGEGFAVYVFAQDIHNEPTSISWPKILGLPGEPRNSNVELDDILAQGAGNFTLLGNPFSQSITFGDFETTDISNVVYVYQHNYDAGFSEFGGDDEEVTEDVGGGFRTWNGTTGGLTGGVIAPFQGFFVQATSNSAELTIPTSAISGSGELHSVPKDTESFGIQIAARINGQQAGDMFFSFAESGSQNRNNYDAHMIYPLDFSAFLTMFTSTEGSALQTKHLPIELAEPLSMPIHIEAWKPNQSQTAYEPLTGTVEMIWPQMDNVPDGWSIFLTDSVTGTVIDLLVEDSYSFEMGETQSARVLEHKFAMRSADLTEKAVSRFSVTFISETSTSTPEQGELPREVSLSQNYPNPFNPTTLINFELPAAEEVRLEVFNVQGQRVATLVNGTVQAGVHNVSFDASALSSGVYLYRLQAANQVLTRKMTLIK
ncbi:Por secretion system C-terminal sorting domain-containing protein [Cyclonatronum proteinivorum]|uniref:Por secretion system C-terminal sorting domain-containing protein n=1 Tax=Cyclonatronum proteinivorum TaxID=1457365 RepID=A0A345UIS2_9BACT|nr:T9SS type A sorting domain-containing protein [Cyclonatronum proteinivorum]AXJ00374.1 Por secretion system C-terminal sorting domain-containing protein [Cyclonatronum proteinivorum]